jgi:hypothetical protein
MLRLTYFFCSVFQFVMAVDAVYARNTLQFICLTLATSLLVLLPQTNILQNIQCPLSHLCYYSNQRNP